MHYHHAHATPSPYETVNWADVAPHEPKSRADRFKGEWTEFTTGSSSLANFFSPQTGANAPTAATEFRTAPPLAATQTLRESSVGAHTNPVKQPGESDVAIIAKQRIQLMAARYAGGTDSSEIVARLEILSNRLLHRAPRVTKAQVSALESLTDELMQLRDDQKRQAQSLGFRLD